MTRDAGGPIQVDIELVPIEAPGGWTIQIWIDSQGHRWRMKEAEKNVPVVKTYAEVRRLQDFVEAFAYEQLLRTLPGSRLIEEVPFNAN